MRIRQVKPEFFKDARLAELSDAVRLFYIGLWLVADDAGYFRADVPEIGMDLYGYRARVAREKSVMSYLSTLQDAGRIKVLACGHGFIPTLSGHQHLAGETRRVYTFKAEHQKGCPVDARGDTGLPRAGIGIGTDVVRSVKERSGTPRAGEPDGPLAEMSPTDLLAMRDAEDRADLAARA